MADFEPTYGASPDYSQHSTSYDEIDTGQIPLVSEPIVVASGQGELPRGSVLGKVAATGKFTLSEADAEDGSENPICVLATAVISGVSDVKSAGYVMGQFIFEALTVGNGHDLASLRAAWACSPLFIVTSD